MRLMSLLVFKSTYFENKHMLTLTLYDCFSFGLGKVSHNESLGFFCAMTDSFTGRALPKGTGVLGKGMLKSIS